MGIPNTAVMERQVEVLLVLNEERIKDQEKTFDPLTGEGSIGKRKKFVCDGMPFKEQWLPVDMFLYPLVRRLAKFKSVDAFLVDLGVTPNPDDRAKVVEQFVRIRIAEDVVFWFASFCYIKQKGGGEDVLFRLNRPQRKLIEWFEDCRHQGVPIRLIMLKARQWGGSTAVQLYMAWLQLVQETGLNSLIIAHVKDTSVEIKDMFDKLLTAYPVRLLHEMDEPYNENEPKQVGVGNATNIKRIPQRNCKIKIGTAEKPDSCRGGDYNLVHLSEVGLWKTTEGKTPEQIVRSAQGGMNYTPNTMVVYESTANGTGNFFHREWISAVKGESKFKPLFVAWYEIEKNVLPFASKKEKEAFASKLWQNRANKNAMSDREEPGRYLWKLWKMGATLEAINWYVMERSGYHDHADMAAECPSDPIEAFKHSGARVFDEYAVEKFRSACKDPKEVGDVYAESLSGADSLTGLRFVEDHQGLLWIWKHPQKFDDVTIENRYVVVVDIGGTSNKADWSVIVVFDRYPMILGDGPEVVAQWYGHIDMDLLAWKAAQIATYYDNAYLVIESNTLETKDKNRSVEGGDQSAFILDEIKDTYENLYARGQSAEDIRTKAPVKYGFHTNVKTKPEIISTLRQVIRDKAYIERDSRCLDEYLTYEKDSSGAYNAVIGKHDDLLMTRAIGLHVILKQMEFPVMVKISAPVLHEYVPVSEADV
jgi:hypothetical protein